MHFNKLYLSVSLLLIGALWVACVDIPSGPGTNPNPDFRSLVRFVHAVEGVAAGNVNVDGSPVGSSISYLGNTAYIDLPSGSRSLSFGGGAAVVTGLTSEQQSSVIVYRAADNSIAYLNLAEGHMNKNNGVAGFARIKFVHVANGSSPNVSFDSIIVSGSIASTALGASSQYFQLDPGTRNFFARSSGGYVGNLAGGASASTGKVEVDYTHNGPLVINATIRARNSEGFFTSAGLHGSDGTLLYSIPVTAHTMSFDTAKMSGVNEVPSVTTLAKGTGLFTLWRDSLRYSITVTVSGDPVDTMFTAAHFHRAAAGVNGPVVRTIVDTPWTDASKTFTGTWARTDSLAPLTDALIDDIINDRIYVNFHSTGHPAGAIRSQITSTTTLVGFPRTITAAQGARNTFADSLNQGLISSIFRTALQPGGAINGQLAVDPAKGVYAVDSLATTDQTFESGKMYTLIATGSGPTFNILKLEDRRFGVSKPVVVPEAVKKPSTISTVPTKTSDVKYDRSKND